MSEPDALEPDALRRRSADAVLHDHLARSRRGDLEGDLARNYAPDAVALSACGVHRGHQGLRVLARLLRRQLPDATFHYTTVLVEGEMGFLEWTAEGGGRRVRDGADSYHIRDGRILAQTIHYTVETTPGRER